MRYRFGFERLLMDEAGEPAGGGGSILSTPVEPVEPTEPTEPTEPAPFDGPEWLAGMDEEFRTDASLQHVPDVNTLVKNYVNAQKMIGKDKITIPDELATEDDLQAFYDKLGRPEQDKYAIKFGESGYNEDFQKGFVEAAHKSGILPKQAQGLFDYFQGQVDAANTAHETQSGEESVKMMDDLKTEWGNGFEKNVSIAKTAVDTLTDDSFKAFLNESGLGDHPTMIKMFTAIGNKLNEDTFDRDTVKNLGLTKDDAQENLDRIMGDQDHPYWNSSHPSHKKAVTDMMKYHEILG